LPSAYEGFGRPYVEALASGTPVVATPNPGAIEVLAHGRYGEICDPVDLGATLVRLLGDNDRRRELAREGLARARDFDWNRVTRDYVEVYLNVITASARRIAS
jgi:glycosyltransferase involved in cell wall biosynthesis